MSPFSLVTCVLLICILVKEKKIENIFINVLALSIAYELLISVGYFIKIGSFEIGHSEFLIILSCLLATYMCGIKGVNKKLFTNGLLLFLSCITSLFLQFLLPYSKAVVPAEADWDKVYFSGEKISRIMIGGGHIKELVHLLIYIIIIIQVKQLCNESFLLLAKKTSAYCRPLIWFGYLEILFIFIKKADVLYSLEKIVMGNSYFSDAAIRSLGVSARLRGLKSEPSMYAYCLLLCALLFSALYEVLRKKRLLLYICGILVLLVLSKAFAAVVCLMGFIVINTMLVSHRKRYRWKTMVFVVTVVALIVTPIVVIVFYSKDFNNYYLHRMHLALINFDDLSITGWGNKRHGVFDGSTKVRLVSIVGTFKYWLERPLFGLALGSTYSHSTLSTIFASIGIVGVYFWSRFTFFVNNSFKRCFLVFGVWMFMLLLIGNGVFPFSGVQNVIVYFFFSVIDHSKSNKGEIV